MNERNEKTERVNLYLHSSVPLNDHVPVPVPILVPVPVPVPVQARIEFCTCNDISLQIYVRTPAGDLS